MLFFFADGFIYVDFLNELAHGKIVTYNYSSKDTNSKFCKLNFSATFTLEGDCTAIGSEDAFKDSLRAQLSIELQISESEITYLEVACGKLYESLFQNFTLKKLSLVIETVKSSFSYYVNNIKQRQKFV